MVKPKPPPAAPEPQEVKKEDVLVACKSCKRVFNSDRLKYHEDICTQIHNRKRKVFDSAKQRIKGTEIEKFIQHKKPIKHGGGGVGGRMSIVKSNTSLAHSKSISKMDVKKSFVASDVKKSFVASDVKKSFVATDGKKSFVSTTSGWRRNHEDFVNTVNAAKMLKAHIDQGGKGSVGPQQNSGLYTVCPHCGKKLNVSSALRHIRTCTLSYQVHKANKSSRPSKTVK